MDRESSTSLRLDWQLILTADMINGAFVIDLRSLYDHRLLATSMSCYTNADNNAMHDIMYEMQI